MIKQHLENINQEKELAIVHLCVKRRTKRRLLNYGEMGDTMDKLVNKLLDKIEDKK